MTNTDKQYPLSVPGAIQKILDDLAWRGPKQERLAYITLERQHACIILGALEALKHESSRKRPTPKTMKERLASK